MSQTRSELDRAIYEGRVKAELDMRTMYAELKAVREEHESLRQYGAAIREREAAAKELETLLKELETRDAVLVQSTISNIRLCERLLKRAPADADRLREMPLADLRRLAETLEAELPGN